MLDTQPDNPRYTIEICLPNSIHPGFGHIFTSMMGMLTLGHYQNAFCFLNDSHWYYGKWTDYFLPFWDDSINDEMKKKGLPNRVMRVEDGNTDPNIGAYYGMIPLLYNSGQRLLKRIFPQIYCPKQDLEIEKMFQNIDIAIHIRTGDHFWKQSIQMILERFHFFKEKLDPKKVFIMTDDYEVVCQFKLKFDDLEIVTLCPATHNGIVENVRSSNNCHLFIQEVEIAKNAKHFIGSWASQASTIVDLYRQEKNVFYI